MISSVLKIGAINISQLASRVELSSSVNYPIFFGNAIVAVLIEKG
jgi:hypothetical protein